MRRLHLYLCPPSPTSSPPPPPSSRLESIGANCNSTYGAGRTLLYDRQLRELETLIDDSNLANSPNRLCGGGVCVCYTACCYCIILPADKPNVSSSTRVCLSVCVYRINPPTNSSAEKRQRDEGQKRKEENECCWTESFWD